MTSVQRQRSDHLVLHGGDRLACRTPALLSVGGELRREFSTMFCFERPPDEASFLETAENAIHCLPADKRSTSEVGVG